MLWVVMAIALLVIAAIGAIAGYYVGKEVAYEDGYSAGSRYGASNARRDAEHNTRLLKAQAVDLGLAESTSDLEEFHWKRKAQIAREFIDAAE